MKPRSLALTLVLFLALIVSSNIRQADTNTITPPQTVSAYSPTVEPVDYTVYITRTGAKYHRGSCRYLRQSKIKTTKKAAEANGYEPCKVCRP